VPAAASARRLRRLWVCCAAVLMSVAAGARADCYDDAARYEHVNPMMLRAIVWQESHANPSAKHGNANGSVDIGIAQINSVHFPALAAYGIAPTRLFDGCVNVYVEAWLLKQKMNKYGNTWKAVGAYHSETPDKRDAYARSIRTILIGWGQLPASEAQAELR
jgi:soluble lytic murein transglycosylase-like protein